MPGFLWCLRKRQEALRILTLARPFSSCLWNHILIIALWAMLGLGSAWAQPWVPPAPPEIPPIISETYANDADDDRINDELQAFADDASMVYLTAVTKAERDDALTILGGMVDVELIFKEPVKQQQIDDFLLLGGEITYMYQAVSYGWNGRIPLQQIALIPALMGPTLIRVDQPAIGTLDMDLATQTGRVRPIWKNLGFHGNSNITIGIIDSGVDETHRDLLNRCVYWKDFNNINSPHSVDYGGHGSHVAGIAVGTGAAGGKGPNDPYYFTQIGNLDGVARNRFYSSPINLPPGTIQWKSTATWLGGGRAYLYHYQNPKGSTQPWHMPQGSESKWGYSPLTLDDSFRASSANLYSAALQHEETVQDYVIVNQVTDPSGTGDAFNKFSGVAPACNWAASKTFDNTGKGITGAVTSAFDEMVLQNEPNNVKVINISQKLWINEQHSDNRQIRNKFNSGTNKGVVVVVSAGNDADESTEEERKMADPARAALVITVGATNDENRLTKYSTYGFANPDNSEDYKPDVIAPGGSKFRCTQILSVDSDLGNDGAFNDKRVHDYTSMQGTSMASPFVAGCAALVIDAMEQKGITWDFSSNRHPRYVKMVLCATATETNADRENNGLYNPFLQRAEAGPDEFPQGKDRYEGYGMINPDAAVEAVALTYNWETRVSETLGPDPTGRRAWARTVHFSAGRSYSIQLDNRPGCDFDLYLYSATPTSTGTPHLLDWSTSNAPGVDEQIDYPAETNMDALLVVKRVSGTGRFELSSELVPTAGDLIGWWTFDGDMLDSSGFGNDGIAFGNPTFVNDEFGMNALYLDGDDYVVVDGVANDITSNDITLSGWVKTTDPHGFFLSCNGVPGGNANKALWGIDKGLALIYDGSKGAYEAYSNTIVNDDTWHMLTYVRSGSTGYIYVDGERENTHTADWAYSPSDRWSIGQEWDNTQPSEFLTGSVDDVRIYDRALTEAELELILGTLPCFIVIDDFEAYNDHPPIDPRSNRIFDTWLDGFSDPAGPHDNGAFVGHIDPPFAETVIVHSGSQSMLYTYDNVFGKSVATMTLDHPRDWTEQGLSILSLWFQGVPSNNVEPMYVALTNSNGPTAAVYHDDPSAVLTDTWERWPIDLKQFADQGVNLTDVDTLSIGFGNRQNPQPGGSGKVYFDDIRLYSTH